MLYRKFKELNLSRLGFGGMRLPLTQHDGPIDEEKMMDMIRHAYDNGVNYYDTAFFYHAGESERLMGKALAQFPRGTWYLADKFPGNFITPTDDGLFMDLKYMGMGEITFRNAREVFEWQLKKCGVEYFDFYMLHNLAENTFDFYTDKKLGIVEYLLEEKKEGRIRHLGISAHARADTLDTFLNMYDCIEFVQIQLNYLDWTLQDAGKKYDVITKHGLPVIVMEPVRGGKLARPGEKAAALLKAARPDETPASWAFRYLQALDNVSVVLSGMSEMEQLKENLAIFNVEGTINEEEKAVLDQVVETIGSFVPCTGCRYCCDACPSSLDIPVLLSAYNEARLDGVTWYVTDALEPLADDKKPQSCTGCAACTAHCPQDIDIPGELKGFCALLEKK